MMFSMEKRSGRSGSGSGDSEMNGGEGLVKEGVPSDEVYSAVAAVSDEIGDILKDELGDADRADRIGAELADLSAELGLLAGLADGEPQQDFPSLFEIAMGHRSSGSGSSSSSWSGRRLSGRPRAPPRRRPIAKGKEASRRRNAQARRAALRIFRSPPSDASDVGADSDSDDQWTELEDGSGLSDTSSGKEAAVAREVDCEDYHKEPAEAPALGQFLLPLLSSGPTQPDPEHFLIRHEDILQLLASAEESVRDELPLEEEEAALESQPDVLSSSDVFVCEEPPVTPEEEAALLHYVCEAEHVSEDAESEVGFRPVEEWLLGVFHSWCEISALMYTLIGTEMSVEAARSEWWYRASFGCHCHLCLCLADNAAPLHRFLRGLLWALAHGGNTTAAAGIMRALRLRAGTASRVADWDIPRLQRLHFGDDGAAIVHEQLSRLAQQNEIANQIVNKVCLCREHQRPFEKEYAVERFCKILENFKAASTITFKVEMSAVEGLEGEWVVRARRRLARFLAPHQKAPTARRLSHMAARTTPQDLTAWSGYKHRCDCLNPRTLCAQQRKQLLSDVYYRISFFGMMQAVNEFNSGKMETTEDKSPSDLEPDTSGRELQQGDGTGAKPPDSDGRLKTSSERDMTDSSADLDELSASESGTGSSGASCSSASASASGSGALLAGGLCGAVRRLVRSIAAIERLMDRVLRHCADCPTPPAHGTPTHRKRVDLGLSEVDRKLMAMYRRLPDVHRRQLQVYRRQKKLSTVCAQLVGGSAPAPPPPGSPPPPPPHQPCRALCPEYHLQRFKEVRRKVMHMRDQQLYYHRLRMWLEDQLRHERESLPDSNVTLVEDLPRRKRRTASPKAPRLTTAPKRKLKPASPAVNKPHKILQMLKHKLPPQAEVKDEPKSEVEPPEAFPLDREDNISDTETVVGERDGDMCKDMKDCLAKFANFALTRNEKDAREQVVKNPESVSPPLQEASPTSTGPMPVYSPKPNQRLILVNKLLRRNDLGKSIDFQSQAPEALNVPINARRTPILVKDETEESKVTEIENCEVVEAGKEASVYKYVTFGLEIKKAMEECENIINSYNSIKEGKEEESPDGPLSLEHICEVMMSLDKNAEYLECLDSDESIEGGSTNIKLLDFVENMPQILATMPEIASKLSEFANASFELPEFASIMSNLPEAANETQLTPETLKQIRELRLTKSRDGVKVTKNTAKRKNNRRSRNSIGPEELLGTMTFELDSKDLSELLNNERDLETLMNNKNSKDDLKDLLFSISAQVVINKVFEYVKQNKSPELVKCLEEDRDLLGKNILTPEMYTRDSTLFDNSVKDALSMEELRELVRSRFNSWKHYVASKFKSIPMELLENEIETMLDKFQSYIHDLTEKQCTNESDKISEKIEEVRRSMEGENDSDNEGCVASRESLKQITKLLSPQAGNTFDLLIMKLSKMTEDQKATVKSLKFKYTEVVRRCIDSQQLINWILYDPETAADVILEHTGLPAERPDNVPDFSAMSLDRKKEYFTDRLREMNRIFMQTLPKKALTGDEWLVMLYRLEQLEEFLKDTFAKIPPPTKQSPQTQVASEAEILAAKGLSKIIGKANAVKSKKTNPEPKPIKKEEKPPEVVEIKEIPKESNESDRDERRCKNEALLSQCEAILTSKGEKELLDGFYTIKSYITQGLPVPETYKKHVLSICSRIDAKLLDEGIAETFRLRPEGECDIKETPAPESTKELAVQSPEMLAKYSAQALRSAKHTLNAVAFKAKSESDTCDTPKSECKWTSDCACSSCRESDSKTPPLDTLKAPEVKGEEKRKAEHGPKPKPPPKQRPKACENAAHQQHVCKAVGHGGGNACAGAGDPSSDQPCSCCYCTVFGHAPPLTTPVPRNFNETRERLRSILNKKKQKCKTTNGEAERRPQVETPTKQVKPPALPKTLPPSTPCRPPVEEQRQLTDRMAKMTVSEKPKVAQRNPPPLTGVPSGLKAEGKVNPNAMEQIRLQQMKQQQMQQQQALQQQQQQMLQQQQQQMLHQQKKPEPIYDLPIHNKPKLTPQQEQRIILQQIHMQQQHIAHQHHMIQQHHKRNLLLEHMQQKQQNHHLQNHQQHHQYHIHQPLQQHQHGLAQEPQQKPQQQMQQPQQQMQQPQQQMQQPQQQMQQPQQQMQQPQQQMQQPQQQMQQPQQQLQQPQQQMQQPQQQMQQPQQLMQQPQHLMQQPLQQMQQPPLKLQQPLQQMQQPPLKLQQPQQVQQQKQQQVQQQKQQQVQQQKQQQVQQQKQQQVQQQKQQQMQQQKLQQLPKQQQHPKQQQKQTQTTPQPQQAIQQQQIQQQQMQQQQQQLLQQKQQMAKAQQQQKQQQQQAQPKQQQQAKQQQPQQQKQQKQQQQQPQQQQKQQRQGRSQQQRAAVSLSSRDTSVFSTSSGCSGGSFWRCDRAEDPRDLDALLQYIEGPQRHVDRSKKRAKKQRQRAKKMETRLLEQQEAIRFEVSYLMGKQSSLEVTLRDATRSVQEARAALAPYRTKRKGKKQDQNPAMQAKVQLLARQLANMNPFIATTAKELQAAKKQEEEAREKLRQCDRELEEVRAAQRAMDGQTDKVEIQEPEPVVESVQNVPKQPSIQQKQIQEALGSLTGDQGGVVRVRRAGEGVTLSVGGRPDVPLAQLRRANGALQALSAPEAQEAPSMQQPPKQEPPRKQTWEQALAHINQLAKGSGKEKKKQKENQAAKAEKKQAPKEQPKAQPAPPAQPEVQTLSKKQRKLLAKQQAEEEEKKKEQQLKQQQQIESKKKEKKAADPPKVEPVVNKKAEKKAEANKKAEEKAKKKEEKKEIKKENKKQEKAVSEKKGKENKQEKNAPAPATKAKQANQQPAQQQNTKKEKKKESQQQKQQQQKAQVINITPDTTLEVVGKKTPSLGESDKPPSCSIMEQLSSGVQVADLKLPPGITLTRVQPSEKKEPPPIKSVPLWRCSALAAQPTQPRPPPVITADPASAAFSTAAPECFAQFPEAPKAIIVPEPTPAPAPAGKSKKAKKKAKKAAAAETDKKPEGAKMVTLRNPMFHPNLPPVQITNTPAKKPEIRIPEPIPMPPAACQATITPTSNGMYTIRNPLMSMMHQQSLMGMRNQTPAPNPLFTYTNPNTYPPAQNASASAAACPPAHSPTQEAESELQQRMLNLASFTKKSDEGYSLFVAPEETRQGFLPPPERFEPPKPVPSPSPIGTRPGGIRAAPQQPRPPFGGALYSPFGREDSNVFRHALFSERGDVPTGNAAQPQDMGVGHMANGGDPLPYFQRLRVGSKLNSEVTIHHVTESKFYKGQECGPHGDESLFSRPSPPWPDALYHGTSEYTINAGSPSPPSCEGFGCGTPPADEVPGAIGERADRSQHESSVFLPDRTITNLSALEAAEREIESFKRFDFYFEPPRHKPRVRLDVNALRPTNK